MLEAEDVVVNYGSVTAVAGVTITVPEGPSGVGLVGESGSGKTTLARAMLRLTPVSAGRIRLDGHDVTRQRGSALGSFRRSVQVVLQDADGSLSPRMRVGSAIAEVLAAHRIGPKATRKAEVLRLLGEVGLEADLVTRLPHQLSGGQRQRVGIARALAVRPRLVILDEPTSALDVTVQDQILTLVEQLRREHGLGYLLISHNLAVIERLCEEVHVLYLGRLVESGPTSAVLTRPAHPYTAALRSAVPQIASVGVAAQERIVLPGIPADPAHPPSGCVFHPRCPIAIQGCRTVVPPTVEVAPGRQVACHRTEEVLAGSVDLTSTLATWPLEGSSLEGSRTAASLEDGADHPEPLL